MAFHRITDPERLHALIDAMLLIEVDADLDDVLRTIVDTAAKLVGARYGALGVVGGDGRSLTRFITYGVDDETRDKIGPIPHGHGVLGETIRRAEPVRVDRLREHASFEGFPDAHPEMERFLGVPVRTNDNRVFGNLYLVDRLDGEPFDEEDELLVEAFGRAAGLVIDQAELRRHLRELTIGEERERLARDLHDTVIQRLFGVGLALQMSLHGEMNPQVRERIDVALDELDRTIHEIRTTIFEIDQEGLDGMTLSQRVEQLVDEVGARLGIKVALRVAANIDQLVSPHCAQHTVQALREILSNIVRHAEATAVTIDLDIVGEHLVLSATDNGKGFVASLGPGRGLRNLTSRANELGGDCTVNSAPERGTLVQWTAKRLA